MIIFQFYAVVKVLMYPLGTLYGLRRLVE